MTAGAGVADSGGSWASIRTATAASVGASSSRSRNATFTPKVLWIAVLAWVRKSESRPSSRNETLASSSDSWRPDSSEKSACNRAVTSVRRAGVGTRFDMHRPVDVLLEPPPVDGRDLGHRRPEVCFCGCHDGRVHPVSLSFEGIGRQPHSPSPRVPMNSSPVQPRSGHPQSAGCHQHRLNVGAAISGMRERSDRRTCVPALELLPQQRGQSTAGADLEEDAPCIREQPPRAVCKANRLAELACPIGVVGRLRVGDPVSGQARDEWSLRRTSRNLRHHLGEAFDDRLHHRRVERVRGGELLGCDSTALQLALLRRRPTRGLPRSR